MLVSPSASGRFSLPFISELVPGQGEALTAFVPVAPVGVQAWSGPSDDQIRKSLTVRASR